MKESIKTVKRLFLLMLLTFGTESSAESILSLDCIGDYRSLLSKNVSLKLDLDSGHGPKWSLENPMGYYGPIPSTCWSILGKEGNFRIIENQNKLFYFLIKINSPTPKLGRFIDQKNLSLTETALRKEGLGRATLRSTVGKKLDLQYTVKRFSSGFEERLEYLAYEATYE